MARQNYPHLPPGQQKALMGIFRYQQRTGSMPSWAELAAEIGTSKNVGHFLKPLYAKGYLIWRPRKSPLFTEMAKEWYRELGNEPTLKLESDDQ